MMNATLRFPALTLSTLRAQYAAGRSPSDLIGEIFERIAERGDDAVWIYRPSLEEILAQLPTDPSLPLFGIPFAVKDNIDVAGWPTTAGCREFSYIAGQDATVVRRLRAAGAIPIGKTNLDQFATGLVGTRSPFGIPRSVFDSRFISGGSSSGSAVAVAAGLVCFALGTDTAGSGRVPAAFNNLVGLKPTRGLISTFGVVPACRSLDCVSLFTNEVAEAEELLALVAAPDPADPYSRSDENGKSAGAGRNSAARRSVEEQPSLRIGVPRPEQLEFFGDDEAEELFEQAIGQLIALGHTPVEINFTPFADAAQLLYSGPWVAERLAAIEPFFCQHAGAMDSVVRQIIGSGARQSALNVFRGLYELERLRKLATIEWEKMDLLFLPTTGTTYEVAKVLADPIRLNTSLGYYTNFVNLLDLCGIAIPAGFRSINKIPFGVTLLGPAFTDSLVCRLARQFLAEAPRPATAPPMTLSLELAVIGAHLSGQPLNHQLTDRNATLVRTCRTAPHYRLLALANTTPAKPGLFRTPSFAGAGIEVEIWSMSPQNFGDFVAQVPQPMTIGTLDLEDGTRTKGFLCEPCASEGGLDVTTFGSWRAYLASHS